MPQNVAKILWQVALGQNKFYSISPRSSVKSLTSTRPAVDKLCSNILDLEIINLPNKQFISKLIIGGISDRLNSNFGYIGSTPGLISILTNKSKESSLEQSKKAKLEKDKKPPQKL